MKAIAALLALAVAVRAAEMFPFQLPWDDATESATNIAWLNDTPAGRDGFVHVKDGRLFAGEKRLRIFGVNVCFAANFPDKDAAPKIAARLAKFGINCVRFHHMDMMSAPGGIFAADGKTLDPGQLDRLDFFIAQLAERGIYADLNLHVSRTHPDRPRAEKKGLPEFDKGVDNFCAAMIALQKDYARDLLTHVNPYTKRAYAAEPAVALVEINNENALGFEWWNGALDDLPEPYRGELEILWGAWLLKKHGTDEKARAAWTTSVPRRGDIPVALNPGRGSSDAATLDSALARDAAGRVAIVRQRDLPATAPAKARDWQEFLWDTETAYWTGMRDFLKNDLGVRAPIVGTQGAWSPAHVQQAMDVIDSHAYWHHPDFHGRGWNSDTWTVKNEPMAGAPDGGELPRLAAQRVAGKPFLCTEYNHPAPNTYSAETFPLLCAFAALQDWDGVFAFSYSHRGAGAWAQEHFNSFFDIDRHPVKMATLPAAVLSFRRGESFDHPHRQSGSLEYEGSLEDALKNGPSFATRPSALEPWTFEDLFHERWSRVPNPRNIVGGGSQEFELGYGTINLHGGGTRLVQC